MPLRVLWIAPNLPWPTTNGGKLRQYHLIRQLAERGHRITLLCQSKTALDDVTAVRLRPCLEHLEVVTRRPLMHPLTLTAALIAPTPLLVTVNGFALRWAAALDRLLKEPWDVVQVEHSYSLHSLLPVLCKRNQPFVLTEHNVESSLGAATFAHLPAFMRPYRAYDQWRYRRWERRVLGLPARLLAVTAPDADRLAAISGRPVDVIVNGVDSRAFAPIRPDTASQRILFVGNFEYAPNVDAVEWAVSQILPLVWQRLPNARFSVCGYAMPESWPRRWTDERIEWKGYVPNLMDEQQASAVFLAPLRAGGGSKLKVLEAMAAGLAVVGTPEAVSGLATVEDRDYLAGRSTEELARQLCRALSNRSHLQAIGESGRRYVGDAHDWRSIAAQLEAIHLEVSGRRQ